VALAGRFYTGQTLSLERGARAFLDPFLIAFATLSALDDDFGIAQRILGRSEAELLANIFERARHSSQGVRFKLRAPQYSVDHAFP
jgi:hypothetical protein